MTDSPQKLEIVSGQTLPPPSQGVTATELIAAGLGVVWVVVIGTIMLLGSAEDGAGASRLRLALSLSVVFLPVAMIWVAVISARSARAIRQDLRLLQIAADGLRQAVLAEHGRRASETPAGPVERKMHEIARATRASEATLATFTSTRETTRRPAPPRPDLRPADGQQTLALGPTADESAPPLARNDLIRALNFPDTDKDEAGFAALRQALKDRQSRQLIQASQDVLTLLSQDGIYMDDLRPDRARPEVWRRFAHGERGRAVAALGGIRDRSCLALAMGRMREDTIFRDAAHHFLRLFDRMLIAFEPEASDEEIADLSETRTARAFMLLGRVTGAFD